MSDQVKVLEKRIQATKDEIKRDWKLIENKAHEGLQEIEHKVSEAKEKISESFNLKKQVEKRPVEMVAGAIVMGFFLGTFGLRRLAIGAVARKVGPKVSSSLGVRRVLSPFGDEIKVLKNVVAGIAIDKVVHFIANKVPAWKDTLNQVSEGVSSKLGGSAETPLAASQYNENLRDIRRV